MDEPHDEVPLPAFPPFDWLDKWNRGHAAKLMPPPPTPNAGHHWCSVWDWDSGSYRFVAYCWWRGSAAGLLLHVGDREKLGMGSCCASLVET